MPITETALLADLKLQFDTWRTSYCAPNKGTKSYFTGYGSPGLPNESILMPTADDAVKKWHANDLLMLKARTDSASPEYDVKSYTLKRSLSGRKDDIFDFTCELINTKATPRGNIRIVERTFCYHIIITGAPTAQEEFVIAAAPPLAVSAAAAGS
jgi:hypothetical protein